MSHEEIVQIVKELKELIKETAAIFGNNEQVWEKSHNQNPLTAIDPEHRRKSKR